MLDKCSKSRRLTRERSSHSMERYSQLSLHNNVGQACEKVQKHAARYRHASYRKSADRKSEGCTRQETALPPDCNGND
eukprot:2315085-Amphidinium_carterae.1